jgi:hypothetical protein
VGGVQQVRLPQAADGAALLVRAQDDTAEALLVQTLPHLVDDVPALEPRSADRCHRAAIEGRRATTMRFFAAPSLLIIDELGCASWGEMFDDPVVAVARRARGRSTLAPLQSGSGGPPAPVSVPLP